jgi:hypothetical protein
MREIELNVLISRCLNWRINDIGVVRKESSASQESETTRVPKRIGSSRPKMREKN